MPHIPGNPTAEHEGDDFDLAAAVREQQQQQQQQEASDFDLASIIKHGSVDLPLAIAGDPGLKDYGTRFRMARGHGYQEKANEFLSKYPDGQLGYRQFPGETEHRLGFKMSDDDPWSKVDGQFLKENDILGDIVDFAGSDLAEIIMELTAIVGTKGKIGLSQFLARIFAGNLTGSTVGELDQHYRGTQEERVPEWAARALGKSAVSTSAAAGAEIVRRGYQVAKGGGFFKSTPGGAAAIAAAKRQGVPIPPVHYLVDHPWLRKIGAQSQAVLPGIDEFVMASREANKIALRKLSAGKMPATLIRELTLVETSLRNKAIRQAEEQLGIRSSLAVAEIGTEVASSITKYDQIANERVQLLYTQAQQLDQPVFDLGGLRAKAQVILDKELGAERIVKKIEKPSSLILPAGVTAPSRVTEQVVKGRGVTKLVDDEVRGVYKEIAETIRLEPRTIIDKSTGEKIIITPTDQLNLWAERLGPYTWSQDGVTYRTQSLAKQGYALLRNILDNPNNLEKTPGFGAAWRTARGAAHERFETLRKVGIARTTDEPIQYLRNAFDSKTGYEKLRHLKDAMPEGRWLEIQNGYFLDLIESSNIDNLTGNLIDLKPEFRSLMLGREGNKVLTELGHNIDKLNHLDLQKILSDQVNYRSIIAELADSTSSADIATVRRMIEEGGGMRSPLGENIRAGIMQHVYESSLRDEGGAMLLNKTELHKTIRKYRATGAFKLMTRHDWLALLDLTKIESVYAKGSDAGTSLLGAEVASKIGHLATAITDPRVYADLIKAKGWGRLLVSESGRKFLIGSGGKRVGILRKLSIINSIIAKALMDDQEIAGDIERYIQEHGS